MEQTKKTNKLKIIIPVAIVAVIAIIAGIVIFTSNGGETKTNAKVYQIGDTIQNDKFEMTLKSVEFVDFINVATQAHTKYKQEKVGVDDFGLPVENEKGSAKLTAKEDEAILSYTLEYKFLGKSEYHSYSGFGHPIVKYDGDYIFSENYLSVVNDGNSWTLLCIDENKMRISMMYSGSTYKPLDNTTYSVRGAIVVPAKVKSDTESSLTINFYGLGNGEYKIR